MVHRPYTLSVVDERKSNNEMNLMKIPSKIRSSSKEMPGANAAMALLSYKWVK